MLAGNNGLLSKTAHAREETIKAQEKEQIAIAWSSLVLDKTTGKISNAIENEDFAEKFEVELNKNGDNIEAIWEDESDYYKVTFGETGHIYSVDSDGNINYIGKDGIISVGKSIIVSFDANGGNVSSTSKKVYVNKTYGELPTPTREGYTFYGWKSENDDYIYSSTQVEINENHTLYARWFDEKQILLYDIPSSKQTKKIYKKDISYLYDLSENKTKAVLRAIDLTSDEKAIQFNGSSSYADVDLNSTLEFPLTVELDISTTSNSNSIIYMDGNTKIALGIYGNYFICVGGSTDRPMYAIPSDFFDGNMKHIVVEYESIDSYKVYVDGEACSKSTNKNYWSNSGTKFYLGRRSSGTYFNGLLYNFRIYNRTFDENEYTNTNNRNNLVLEYNIENENSFDKIEQTQELLEDLINNNDSICYNVVLNDSQNGILFNGSSSYVELGVKSELEFPISIEMTILYPQNLSSAVIYADPVSKTAFGYYNGQFITITNSTTMSNLFDAPPNFLDGTPKHIVIEYTDLFNVKVYINGKECNKTSSMNAWDWGSSSTAAYIGRRSSGTYFKGTIYNFSMYNSLLPEDIIKEKYRKLNI